MQLHVQIVAQTFDIRMKYACSGSTLYLLKLRLQAVQIQAPIYQFWRRHDRGVSHHWTSKADRLFPQAFSWYGFNDGSTMVGGLWAGAHTQVGDFATVVYRAQLLGFNAVRLPFRCAAPVDLRRTLPMPLHAGVWPEPKNACLECN